MFDIVFYQNSSPDNCINKNLSNPITLTGELKEESSIISPSITIQRDERIFNYNYCYIEKFHRYYSIKNIINRNPFFEIVMSVDVLETYKNDILESTQIIGRQENEFNLNLIDDEIPRYCEDYIDILKFGETPFNTSVTTETVNTEYNYILIASGKKILTTGDEIGEGEEEF